MLLSFIRECFDAPCKELVPDRHMTEVLLSVEYRFVAAVPAYHHAKPQIGQFRVFWDI